ncbi:MAG: 4Fe-4S binding protein [Acutalibacteraceae bacterium]
MRPGQEDCIGCRLCELRCPDFAVRLRRDDYGRIKVYAGQ